MAWSLGVARVAGTVALLALGAKPSVQSAQDKTHDYTLSTTSRLVLLDVSVKNANGGLVSDLTREQFKVYEDGKLQDISQFSSADVPVTVGLVIDESSSMRPKRQDVLTAALEFIHDSNPQDEMFVVNFNEKAKLGLPAETPFSDQARLLWPALFQSTADGRTALYDAIELALQHLTLGRRDKKTLVVVSDGGDNASHHTLNDVMRDVLASVTTIYTVGIFDQDDPDKNPGVLEKLAHVSGGVAYLPKTLDQVIPICKQIAKDIRTRYSIGYIPPSAGKPTRHIKVTASAPGHPNLIVRARTSYTYGPDSEAAALK
jgi:Ca-activated chloride channel homolog